MSSFYLKSIAEAPCTFYCNYYNSSVLSTSSIWTTLLHSIHFILEHSWLWLPRAWIKYSFLQVLQISPLPTSLSGLPFYSHFPGIQARCFPTSGLCSRNFPFLGELTMFTCWNCSWVLKPSETPHSCLKPLILPVSNFVPLLYHLP